MLERDYITEIILQFVKAVTRALRLAVEKGDAASCQAVEQQVADLIDLDVQTTMALSPDSLVTMLLLSGMGDSLAVYVCYALDRLSRVYGANGNNDLAGLRHLQAQAVAESFDCDLATPPAELSDLDVELFGTAEKDE
ncbi:hypothetical protein [Olsenella sp. Marseille-P4559]|uniref:hypothetical protein n=1 Tax=Olsenella sp. Marseille-P4559 TaxID=2364795 RepID=UPI0010302E53|nr:hypothetical protein [Olsenella sp. Marseille-P4559]